MSVPNFIGLLDLDEQILTDSVNLNVESRILGPGRREKIINVMESLIK